MNVIPPANSQPSQHRVGILLSWLVIASVVGFVAYRNWAAYRTERLEHAAEDVTMSMAARFAVGSHAVLRFLPAAAQNERQIVEPVLAEAKSPPEKLRAVTVLAEVRGAPAALDELNRIAPRLKSPDLSAAARTLQTIYTSGTGAVPSEGRQKLVEELGWFGRLALTFEHPSTDPPRHAIVSQSVRAFVTGVAFEIFIVLIFATGIGLFTWAVIRLIDGRVRLAYKPPTFSVPFLEAFALYLAGYVGIGLLARRFIHAPTWSIYLIDLVWVAFACAWPMLRGVTWTQVRQGLGWHTGRGIWREMGAGIVGYIVGMPLMAAAVYTTALLSKLSHTQAVHPIVFEAGGNAAAIVGLYLMASVWAPIVEETMFRGALFHHLRGHHRWLFSAALSAFIFASLHPQGWTAIPVLGMIGFIFAGIREWRGTTLASATAHAINNAVMTTLLVLTLG